MKLCRRAKSRRNLRCPNVRRRVSRRAGHPRIGAGKPFIIAARLYARSRRLTQLQFQRPLRPLLEHVGVGVPGSHVAAHGQLAVRLRPTGSSSV
jgi:hypothetical protein